MPFPAKIYAIAGQAPTDLPGLPNISNTEKYLNHLIAAYLPETVRSILGGPAHDTIVPLGSQLAISGGTSPNDIVDRIVHTALSVYGPSYDTGETRSEDVWILAYRDLTGIVLSPASLPLISVNATSSAPPVSFDLPGTPR